jgi:hypothetical protein
MQVAQLVESLAVALLVGQADVHLTVGTAVGGQLLAAQRHHHRHRHLLGAETGAQGALAVHVHAHLLGAGQGVGAHVDDARDLGQDAGDLLGALLQYRGGVAGDLHLHAAAGGLVVEARLADGQGRHVLADLVLQHWRALAVLEVVAQQDGGLGRAVVVIGVDGAELEALLVGGEIGLHLVDRVLHRL